MLSFPSLHSPKTSEIGFIAASYVIIAGIVYALILRPLYNIFAHPLRKYPGPKTWAASRIPLFLSTTSGKIHHTILDIHHQYGDVVRIAPNELSFVRPGSWKDIMSHRKEGQEENGKDPIFYAPFRSSILGAPREEHSHIRRVLSHGFSAKRMLEQQPIIQQHIGLLFRRLHENSEGGMRPIDVVQWYNYTSFDIISDLSFGEPLKCLESSSMHPWVAILFRNIKQLGVLASTRYFINNIDRLMESLFPSALDAKMKNDSFVEASLAKRLAIGGERPDFVDSMAHTDKGKLSWKQMQQTANVLIVAGSETTATVLSFATFLLCKSPQAMAKAIDEVRSTFSTKDEINITRVQSLRYTLAVLNETMRMFPAAPTAFPRVAGPGGQIICGEHIPENVCRNGEKTILSIHQWVMYHYQENFVRADEFIPERWLKDADPIFQNDMKHVFLPFSYGARDCIGKNLAYSEMRVILARMLFEFDLTLDERSESWASDLHAWILWEKPPLYVFLKPHVS